jgi:hypothetical protein
MADRVTCPECEEEFDKRGIIAHREHKHGVGPGEGPEPEPVASPIDRGERIVADGGGGETTEGELVVDRESVDMTEQEIESAVPSADVQENVITFRSVQEIEIADPEMKREVMEELKQAIRGDTFRM